MCTHARQGAPCLFLFPLFSLVFHLPGPGFMIRFGFDLSVPNRDRSRRTRSRSHFGLVTPASCLLDSGIVLRRIGSKPSLLPRRIKPSDCPAHARPRRIQSTAQHRTEEERGAGRRRVFLGIAVVSKAMEGATVNRWPQSIDLVCLARLPRGAQPADLIPVPPARGDG
jgi:hypothetical protein